MGVRIVLKKQAIKQDILSTRELSAFCAQISMIMKAGITIGEGLSIMCEDTENTAGRDILEHLRSVVEDGGTFNSALASCGRFPKYMIDMTEIGEATGKLDDVMDSLCAYYEREDAISKNIKNAVTYPLVMIVMMVLVVLVLIVKVMPVFNDVFIQLGSEITGFSRSVMNLGAAIGRYSFVLLGIFAVLAVAFFIFRATDFGKKAIRRFGADFFMTRNINAKIASGRFASAMSLMLASGLDTDQSLDMVYNLVDNEYIRKKITSCKDLIAGGEAFSEALVKADMFTGVYARMLNVGYKTGSVDTVMRKLADRYEEEVDDQIGGVISVIEPTLVVILSLIVGMILLSVMLPLMGVMSSIG